MSGVATPNACAAAALPVTAMKCAPTPAPLTERRREPALALAALASVSSVANDFDVTMNSVVAGSSGSSARVRCSGSTLATNATSTPDVYGPKRRRVPGGGASAAQTRSGPRSEPPMPRLTTARIGRPRRADAQPAADLRRERLHPHLRRADVGDDVAPVDEERRVARRAQRRVQRRPALGLVDLLAGEKRGDPPG